MALPAGFQQLVSGDPTDELVAIVSILRANAISPEKLSAALDCVGSAVELLPVEYGGSLAFENELLLRSIHISTVVSAREEVAQWTSHGLNVRTLLLPSYPANLRAIFNKPPLLFFEGVWDEKRDSFAVAVVGTRNATLEGMKRAFRLAKGLAQRGITVLSGMAKGIDSAAHRGALEGGGRTIAVMGTGIVRRYPAGNRALAAQILDSGGALVSQFFPEQEARPWTFPKRNITMSGMALATVVVEAGATSGAKMQAEAALRHGKPVYLPASLVEGHEWAQRMVSVGLSGLTAKQITSTDDLVDRFDLEASSLPLLSS